VPRNTLELVSGAASRAKRVKVGAGDTAPAAAKIRALLGVSDAAREP
jgi:uncharacterized protein YggU (UPF0235/DUF167 family)